MTLDVYKRQVCSKIYKKSKNPYIGGIIMGILACVVSVTNTRCV